MVVMMANTPELTPEPDFLPVTSTSLLEPTSNVSEGAPPTVVPVINAEEVIYTNIGIFEQFIQEYDQQAPPVMPIPVNLEIQAVISRSPRIIEQFVRDHGQISTSFSRRATPTQSELDLDEKNYKLVLALEHMQYVQERMLTTDPIYLMRYIFMIQQLKKFHSTTRIDMLPAVHLARTTRMSSAIPLMLQLFDLWETCLTMNLIDRPTNILSYQIHQHSSTHTTFQLFVESLLTINVPWDLVDVPHENFIVQPSWLFRCQYQLMLKRMFCYMNYLFCLIFSTLRVSYASLKVQILHDKLVVCILEKGIMLHFVLLPHQEKYLEPRAS